MINRKIFLEQRVKFKIAREIVLLKELLFKNQQLKNILIAIIFRKKKVFNQMPVQKCCKNPTIQPKVNKLMKIPI